MALASQIEAADTYKYTGRAPIVGVRTDTALVAAIPITPEEERAQQALARQWVNKYIKRVPRKKRLTKAELYEALGLDGKDIQLSEKASKHTKVKAYPATHYLGHNRG